MRLPRLKKDYRGASDPTLYLLALLEVTGFYLGHPNQLQHIPLLALFCPMSIYLISLRVTSAKEAFFFTCVPASIGIAGSLYWIYIPLATVGGLPVFFAIPCIFILSMYLACFYGLAGFLFFTLRATPLFKKNIYTLLTSSILYTVFCGVLYGAVEVLISIFLTGFPWLPLATSFVPWTSWIQIASILGNNGLSTLLAIGSCMAISIFYEKFNCKFYLCALGLLLIAVPPVFGIWRLSEADTSSLSHSESSSPVTIGIVQGNIDQAQKWDTAFQEETIDHYLSLSTELINKQRTFSKAQKISLIIWPETAIPLYFEPRGEYAKKIIQFAINNNVNLAFGTLGYKRANPKNTLFYNRFQLVTNKGNTNNYYDKVHLVPFGEYIPLQLDIPFLKNILQGIGFSSGQRVAPIEVEAIDSVDSISNQIDQTSEKVSLGALICYEAIFPELAQEQVLHGASLLVNISNDAWFGKSSAPLQHLSLATMRAVEQKRFFIRSTNSGYSALIDPYGRTLSQGNLFEVETHIFSVLPIHSFSVYFYVAKYLNGFLLLFLAMSIIYCYNYGTKKNVNII